MVMDSSGKLYVTGDSGATWGNPLAAYTGGDGDAYIAKLDFTVHTISGNLGAPGAFFFYTDDGNYITADDQGNYSFLVPDGWSGTVTPATMSGYTFNPTSTNYTNVTSDLANQNYIATPITYTVSGRTWVPGVTMSYNDKDGNTRTVVSDRNGNYSPTFSATPLARMWPSKTGYTFTPDHMDYVNVMTNQTGVNFTPTAIFTSIAAQDGWVLESSENSNAGGALNASAIIFQLGDDASNRQYRAVLSFNTARLPDNAKISAVVLQIKQLGDSVGLNAFDVLGNLLVDIRKGFFGSSSALQLTDFNATATARRAGVFSKISLDAWYSATLNLAGRRAINKTGLTQLRLYFSKDDNNNHRADYMRFFSGNSIGSNRPVLLVTFTLP